MDETSRTGDPMQLGQWVDTTMAAEILEVSERTVRRWIKTGRLRATRTDGGQRLVLLPGSGPPMATRRESGDDADAPRDRGRHADRDAIAEFVAADPDEDADSVPETPAPGSLSPGSALDVRTATLAIAQVERALTLHRDQIRVLRAETRRSRRLAFGAAAVAVFLLLGLVVVASVAVTRRASDRTRLAALSASLGAEQTAAARLRDELAATRERLATSAERLEGLDARLAFQVGRADRAEERQGTDARRAAELDAELHRLRREHDALRVAVAERDQTTIDAMIGRLGELELSLSSVEAALEPVYGPRPPAPMDGPLDTAAARSPRIPWSDPIEIDGLPGEPEAPVLAAPERRLDPPATPIEPVPTNGASPASSSRGDEAIALPAWILLPPPPAAPVGADDAGA